MPKIKKLCGSRLAGRLTRHTDRRCRQPGSGAGGRCRLHGGRSVKGSPRAYLNHARLYAGPAAQRRQALFKAWGIPWYGGRPPKAGPMTSQKALAIMDNALKTIAPVIVDLTGELAPFDVNKPDEEKTANELMNEGLHAGLILGRDVVRKCQDELKKLDAAGIMLGNTDMKILRLGTETAAWLVRASVRVAEGEFRSRSNDVLGKLLEQIAATKAATPK